MPPSLHSKIYWFSLTLVSLLLLSSPRAAHGVIACSAASFSCPAEPALCVITGTWDISQGCVLDFGTQDVEIRGTLRAETVGGNFDVRAANLTLQGGRLLSPGDLDDFGGQIGVQLTGDLTLGGSGATINVSANGGGGDIDVSATNVTLNGGNMIADGGVGEENCGDAGGISISATQHVFVNGSATSLRASTGGFHCSGGEVVILADTVTINKGIDVSGGAPTGIDITALDGDLIISGGSGLNADGEGTSEESGNDGGVINLESLVGNLSMNAHLTSRGSGLDGWGGDFTLAATNGLVTIDKNVDAGAPGLDTFAGSIDITAKDGLVLGGDLTATTTGQSAGGDIAVETTGPITIDSGGEISVAGGASGGGTITVEADAAITIDGTIDTTGGNGGDGGPLDISGCEIALAGTIDAGASGGGNAVLTTLTAARIDILAGSDYTALPCDAFNCNQFVLRSGTATIAPTDRPIPAPIETIDPTLNTCCGNGITDDGTGGTPTSGEQCDDGNFDYCDGCTPLCTLEPVGGCPSDGNECTLDCSPQTGCAYEPLTGTTCSDEPDACTTDVCSAGVCTHVPQSCDDGIACTIDSCDSVSGCIATPDDTACDDEESCTNDTCDAVAGCVQSPVPDGLTCDDGSLCTVNDTCQSGVCTGPPPECDDGDPCTTDTCVDSIGCFGVEDPAACDCFDEFGLPLEAGSSCVDGSGCTIGDTCDAAGTCTAGPTCPDQDGDACTVEACSFGIACTMTDTGCSACVEGEPCSDGDVCTSGICTNGVCESQAISCEDGNACTTNQCLPNIGCQITNFGEGATCVTSPLREFTCYRARWDKGAGGVLNPLEDTPVEDEFWRVDVDSKTVREFCAPANREGLDPSAPAEPDYLLAVRIRASPGSPKFVKQRNLQVTNALGTIWVDARSVQTLLAPTAMDPVTPPGAPALPNPDAFECYKVSPTSGTTKFTPILDTTVEDVFGSLQIDLKKPSLLCNPANVDDTAPSAPTHPDHLLCYKARSKTPFLPQRGLLVDSFLGAVTVDAIRVSQVCIPSQVSAGAP